MSLQILLHILISIMALSFSPFKLSTSEESTKPEFDFSWSEDKETFKAGEIATIKIKVLSNFDKIDKNAFKPTLTVNGKTGNSSYVSEVLADFQGDSDNWKIFFTTISAGLFNVIINEDHYHVFDSSLHFQVQPGSIYPSVCVASWMDYNTEFEAGTRAGIRILPKDAYGNIFNSTSEDPSIYNFTLSALYENGSVASMPNITHTAWNGFGYIIIEFIVVKAGNLFLLVQGGNQTLIGSPLPIKVTPGPLEISNCVAEWNYEPKAWQLFSKMELFLHQQDQYGNLVPGLYEFDAEVIEKETNLSIPVSDLHFEEVSPGIQSFSFSNLEPGNFFLTISDVKHNKSISNMPYAYSVFVGYCSGLNSVVNGSGLNVSTAGETAEFSVYLKDMYHYPSLIEVEWLQVQIAREIDSYNVLPSISPFQIDNESSIVWGMSINMNDNIEIAPSPYANPSNPPIGNPRVLATAFNVVYTPDKSGMYGIRVFCGNIQLNGDHSFKMEVRPGEVNISLSGVVKFASKVPKLVKNEVEVQLFDSFYNPVLSQQSRLKLEVNSTNNSSIFSSWMFVDNNNGSYTSLYEAEKIGTYNICASFDGKPVSPCPFLVNVYGGEYFPRAFDDSISVWEDESIAFDVLDNDYFAGENASVIGFSEPSHGSLLQHGKLLLYTPHKDYYGNDSFTYEMSDINGNVATAAVNISVPIIPPQFVSFPSQLQATEDKISPRFGGFLGFELRYSDIVENISVTLSANFGSIWLSPMPMQFWPTNSKLSAYKNEPKCLVLEGTVEVVNFALKSIQYLGNENFFGDDSVRVSTKNTKGVNNLDVPLFVEPINDPPFIHVPAFIILNSSEDEALIYDGERDKFEFSIGDPDLHGFPGAESDFKVIFSVEVDNGFLVTSLPAEFINSTELRTMNTYQWQPLQTYVTISQHFTVRANGVRFHGTIENCNSVMKQLFYRGEEDGTMLRVTVNDMGNYGCFLDCAEKTSMPLYTEAAVNLIRRRPMTSFLSHALGSAVVIESIMVSSLGGLLLFFTCKCAIVLVSERKKNVIVQR